MGYHLPMKSERSVRRWFERRAAHAIAVRVYVIPNDVRGRRYRHDRVDSEVVGIFVISRSKVLLEPRCRL